MFDVEGKWPNKVEQTGSTLSKTSRTVCDMLTKIKNPYYGCPRTVVTDLGVENMNSEVKQLFSSLHIQHITSF